MISESAEIGRARTATVSLQDPNVGRRHARVERRGDDYVLIDLGAAGGVRVDGRPVREHVLRDGERFDVCDWQIGFFAEPRMRAEEAALSGLYAKLDAVGLARAPVPPALAPALRQFGPWWFGTRETEGLYQYAGVLLDEAERDDVPDYLIVGHAGHGVNSYALHYFLRHGPLLLLFELAFGGAYTNARIARAEIAAAFHAAEALIAAVPALERRGVPAAGLRVVTSSVRSSSWSVGAEGAEGRLQDVLAEACAWAAGDEPV